MHKLQNLKIWYIKLERKKYVVIDKTLKGGVFFTINPLVYIWFLTDNAIYWCRGYQRVGENITKGVPDMHEAIDVG